MDDTGGSAVGGQSTERTGPPLSVAILPAGGTELHERAATARCRARLTRLQSIGLRGRSRRLRRDITGVVLALFTGPPMLPTDPGSGPGTVLVVDDDEAVRESIAAVIALAGYRVITAVDGEEALHLLRTETVDVMVMDLRMPRRDGVSVLRDLPLQRPAVIVHTAASEDVAELQSSMLGAKIFVSLEKPVAPPVLLAAITEAIDDGSRSPSA